MFWRCLVNLVSIRMLSASVVPVFILSLAACSDSSVPKSSSIPSGGAADPQVMAIDDPEGELTIVASDPFANPDRGDLVDSGFAPASTDDFAESQVMAEQISEVRRDKATGRIFIPDMGWMVEREFWRIYEEQPMRLPADLDMHAIHQLRATMASVDDVAKVSAGVN